MSSVFNFKDIKVFLEGFNIEDFNHVERALSRSLLQELLDSPVEFKRVDDIYKFEVGFVPFIFEPINIGTVTVNGMRIWDLNFGVESRYNKGRIDFSDSRELTHKGTLQLWSTIKVIMIDFVNRVKPDKIQFSALRSTKGLEEFYHKMLPILAKELGYRYQRKPAPTKYDKEKFYLIKKD